MSAASFGIWFEIRSGAGDEFLEKAERNIEALGRIADSNENGILRGFGLRSTAPCCLPLLEIEAALFAGNAFVIGEVVSLAHESIDGANSVPARLRKGDEGVVEILGFPFGDCPAGCVRGVQWNALAASLASSGLTPWYCRGAGTVEIFRSRRAVPGLA